MKVGRVVIAVVAAAVACTVVVSVASRCYGRWRCRDVRGMLLRSDWMPIWVDPGNGRRTDFLQPDEKLRAEKEQPMFLRPFHHRGRNVVLCLVEYVSSDKGNWFFQYSLRGELLSRWRLPYVVGREVAVSPDEEWIAFKRADAGSHRLWVGRLENPFDGWGIDVPRLPPGRFLWAGEYLYYTAKDRDGGRRVVRVHWRGGEPEDLGWRGRLITTGGHDPQRIL